MPKVPYCLHIYIFEKPRCDSVDKFDWLVMMKFKLPTRISYPVYSIQQCTILTYHATCWCDESNKIKGKKEGERESCIHFTVRVTPVIPAFRHDNVVHICVCEDHPGERTPCPTKIECSWARDLTVYKWEARFLQQAAPALCCECSYVLCYCVHVTSLYLQIAILT